ncbi:phosphatidate cytidylyltransferase [Candidatus Peregrinibacteria bacterium]|nr:phosphatidate cytidylyltransferase [Candidatus Peregrinibacteria bacterium]
MERLPFDEEALMQKYEPDFAFAYGSGVFRQTGYREDEESMVDLIFAVNNPKDWHQKNMLRHPDDYAPAMRRLGPGGISHLQALGPGVLYNTYVPFQGASLKYGVTSSTNLREDLVNWNSFYLAGRLQKPARILKHDEVLEDEIETNRHYAANAALLLLPERFFEWQFYDTVAGLSYIGDSRNGLAEDPLKIRNMVGRNVEEFKAIYHQILKSRHHVQMLSGIGQVTQDMNPLTRATTLYSLPSGLLNRISRPIDFENSETVTHSVRQGIASIVTGSTRTQTLKDFVSSGLKKSLHHGASRLAKIWQ